MKTIRHAKRRTRRIIEIDKCKRRISIRKLLPVGIEKVRDYIKM